MPTTQSTEHQLPLRELGRSGVRLPALGFGAMGLSEFYGPSDDDQSRELLRELVKLGCTFWDTSDIYGLGRNESLIGSVINEFRDKVFLCTKFGIVRDGENTKERGARGDREYVLQKCDESLKRLGIKTIDLYYQHRIDPNTPIEETMGALKELQDAGKIRFIGLSECSPETLERALKVAHVDAVQIEYSPWEIGPEKSGLLDVMRRNGVSLVAYSPLGRGILTGKIQSLDDLAEDDYRRTDPRFQGENFQLNMRIVQKIGELAEAKSKQLGFTVTPAAFCLAWVLFQGEDFFAIPGTRSINRLKENLTAAKVLQSFTIEDDVAVRKLVDEINVTGERYHPGMMALLNH